MRTAVNITRVDRQPWTEAVFSNLESPIEDEHYDALWVPLVGWALSAEGRPLDLELCDGEYVVRRFARRIERPDVGAEFTSSAPGVIAGFSYAAGVVRLPVEFELRLRARVDTQCTELATVTGRRRAFTPLESDLPFVPLPVTTLGRTGSTLLMTLLGSHPEIVAFEPHEHDSRPFAHHVSVAASLAEPASRLRLVDSAATSEDWWLGRGPAPTGEIEALNGNIRSVLLNQSIDRILHTAVQHAAMVTGEMAQPGGLDLRFAAEKSWPDFVPRLLHELYPATHEIFLVRDFRDVVASMLAFNAKRGFDAFGREAVASDAEFISRLATDVDTLLRSWHERRDRAALVRYEELVTDPEGVLADLFAFLGIADDLGTIGRVLDRANVLLGTVRESHRTTPDAAQSIGRWRRDLPDELQEVCEQAVGEALRVFGYTP